MLRKGTSLLLALSLLLGLTNCATYRPQRIDIRPINEYPNLRKSEGISVAADPYSSMDKAKQAFQWDVTQKGFVPVNLIIDNDTDEPLCIEKENIELFDENGIAYGPVSSKLMFEEFEIDAIGRFAVFSVVSVAAGVVSYLSAKRANRKMEADWQRKEIPDRLIVPPGTRMSGFVYFQLPEGEITKVSKLSLESEGVITRKKMEFEFTPQEDHTLIAISSAKREDSTDSPVDRPNP